MKRRLIFVLVAALLMGGVGIGFLRHGSTAHRVVYQGRTVEQWLGQLSTTNMMQATQAFQKMGPDATPGLLHAFTQNDPAWNKAYVWLHARLPTVWRNRLPRPLTARQKREAAAMALMFDGEVKNVFPELVQILADNGNGSRPFVMPLVVNQTGPANQYCVPIFIDCLKETNSALRLQAIDGLRRIGVGAKAAIPALTNALHDPIPEVRVQAAWAYWTIDKYSKPASAAVCEMLAANPMAVTPSWINWGDVDPADPSLIPIFIALSKNSSDDARFLVMSVLGKHSRAPVAAGPELERLIESGDPQKRESALQLLKWIDPEAAAKYEKK